MNKTISRREAKVARIQELRRSNATTPVRNKSKYTRKIKHKGNHDQY